jgi:uridine kinase
MNYNFDLPEAVDWELFLSGLEDLLAGKPFNRPQYDSRLKIRSEDTVKVHPTEVIIVEGHLIFNNPDLLKHFDLKVFIDTDDDVRLSRRGNHIFIFLVLKEYKSVG